MGETTVDEKERIILYHVLANSNKIYRCSLGVSELRRLSGIPKTTFLRAIDSLQVKGYLYRSQKPPFFVAWPYLDLVNRQAGGSHLWTSPLQVQRLRSLVDAEITRLSLVAQDDRDRKRLSQERALLMDLDQLQDIKQSLELYLQRMDNLNKKPKNRDSLRS